MTATAPLFSIIIDNYNYARFMPYAINSALNQDYPGEYEIIVVDDASNDHSREVMLAYGDKIKTIFLEKNGGQGAAFNAGFAASRGELICFLDADDLFYSNKLSVVAKIAAQHPQAVLFYNKGCMINKSGTVLDSVFPRKTLRGNVREKILSYSESLFPPTSFLTFRRSFLARVLPCTPYLNRIDADFPLQIFAGLLGEVVQIDEPLGYYRLHGDNWFLNYELITANLDTCKKFLRRTEKEIYYINTKLKELGCSERIDLMKHRFHRRNMFIFQQLGWWSYVVHALTNPNFINLKDRWTYIMFGVRRRLEFNANAGR